jgi:hypothetical protein
LTKEQEELSLKPINRGITWRNTRESAEKDVRSIGESELPRVASSGCYCSAAKREKSEVESCKEWMIPHSLLL